MTATDKAYDYLKSKILDGAFREGEFLTEGAISEELGISRTPIREAFLRLEAEAFMLLVPKKGAFIPGVTLREIREVMEARIMIESFAAEKAVARRTEIAPKLRSMLEEQTKVGKDGQTEEFIRLDREFHYAMVGNSGNRLLDKFYDGLRDRQLRMGIQAVTNSPERVNRVLEEHRSIVAAAEEGDAEDLQKAIRDHLDATRVILEEKAYE